MWPYLWAIIVVTVLALPLSLSLWALLDAAKRPRWVWALRGRDQVVWMAVIMFGVVFIPLGLAISLTYLIRIRPELRAVEEGDFGSDGEA